MTDRICKNNSYAPLTGEKADAVKFIRRKIETKNLPMLAVAVFCLFFVASCSLVSRLMPGGGYNYNTNVADSNSSNANATQTAAVDKEKFQKLMDANDEILKITQPVKIDTKPVLKGKVFVFKNVEASYKNGYIDGISSYRRARSLEELQTAIRVNCGKGKPLGDFQSNTNGIVSRAKGFGIVCEVALIDYPSRVIFDKKTFSNNESQDFVTSRNVSAGVYLNPPPIGDIMRYINSLPVDKISPEMNLILDEKELIRAPTTVSLKPDAALKGKIKFARMYEEGDPLISPVKIDAYTENTLPFSKATTKPAELETLVKIVCGKGDKIGQFGKTTQYSSRCEISVIDYKTLTVIAQKTVENRTVDENPSAKDAARVWVTNFPKAEVENYLNSLPQS